ncbi:MAG: ricin-type beta-trefoil lectin domain protein [Rhodobacteraceae bacterium]|nr:ricin-type beta-trefoil lectin domain protein [Paracoccaceae bacterium]
MLKTVIMAVSFALVMGSLGDEDAPPVIQSGTPVIYLAANLDEKDKLGWCIDTRGRGFAETLHAHSCKSGTRGVTDTQFAYDAEVGQIQSVAFTGKCMTLSDPENTKLPFGLLDCAPDEVSQRFLYDSQSMEFRLGGNASNCVVVGQESASAGPFMSRDLLYADCGSTEDRFKQWVVKE